MTAFDAKAYGSAIAKLLGERLMALGPGSPNEPVRQELEALDAEGRFLGRTVYDHSMSEACRAALWLYHDFLNQSHHISQQITAPTGSYWHGIMHRREPDYDNSRYWFRRVGVHPTFGALAEAAARILPELDKRRWDPFRFIDLCAQHNGSGSVMEDRCRRVQLAEWRLLFDYCFRTAIDKKSG
jgi:hypothetical protein